MYKVMYEIVNKLNNCRNNEEQTSETVEMVNLTIEQEARARSAPPPSQPSSPLSPQIIVSPPISPSKPQKETTILIEKSENSTLGQPPPPDE